MLVATLIMPKKYLIEVTARYLERGNMVYVTQGENGYFKNERFVVSGNSKRALEKCLHSSRVGYIAPSKGSDHVSAFVGGFADQQEIGFSPDSERVFRAALVAERSARIRKPIPRYQGLEQEPRGVR